MDGCAWKPERPAWLVWRRGPAAIRNAQGIALVGQNIHHGLEDILDFGNDKACMLVLCLIVWNLHNSRWLGVLRKRRHSDCPIKDRLRVWPLGGVDNWTLDIGCGFCNDKYLK